MSFAQGEAALSPVQREEAKTATAPKVFKAAVVNYTPARFEDGGRQSPAQVIFSGGTNRGVTVGTKVVCDGVNGRVAEVYPTRSLAVFYDTLVTPPQFVEVHLGETWSRAQQDAADKKRDLEYAKEEEKTTYTDELKTRR